MRDKAREVRFVVFITRALLCVNLPRAPFYTRTTHCQLLHGNCQPEILKRLIKITNLKMTALECTFTAMPWLIARMYTTNNGSITAWYFRTFSISELCKHVWKHNPINCEISLFRCRWLWCRPHTGTD